MNKKWYAAIVITILVVMVALSLSGVITGQETETASGLVQAVVTK